MSDKLVRVFECCGAAKRLNELLPAAQGVLTELEQSDWGDDDERNRKWCAEALRRALAPYRPRKRKRAGVAAFTLIELLLVIAIVSVLLSLAVPILNAARESARRAKCHSNLHQIQADAEAERASIGTLLYALAEDPAVGTCPSDPLGSDSYVYTQYVPILGSAPLRWDVARDTALNTSLDLVASDRFHFRHGLRAGETLSTDPFSAQWRRTDRSKLWMDGSVTAMKGPLSDPAMGWMP